MAFYSTFAQYYEVIFPFKQNIFEFLKSYTTTETRKILDLGCGTGHYAAQFAKEGFQTIGIDLDANMIAYATAHYPKATFFTMNMLDVRSLNQRFDFIFCIGNTAAHLTHKEFDILLDSVYNSLEPGGVWLFQVRNWDYVALQKEYTFPVIAAQNGRIRFLRTYTDISQDELSFNTRLIVDGQDIFQDRVMMYPISSRRYREMHAEGNFLLIDHFSDFGRTPFDAASDSANIFVFRKK
ncbi:class I SAM-dependent methyltransferase [candidate division KSB1 bacterium]|nr:MAG: class I SAM-dependent methyltransferase [candidate division KSB1 bacterium]